MCQTIPQRLCFVLFVILTWGSSITTQWTTPYWTTPQRTTPYWTTPQPTTPYWTTPQRTTPQRTTPQRTTPQRTTPQRTTPQWTTLQPTTPQPTTPQRTTPQWTTPQPTTPQPTTPQPTTPQPTTPQPTTPQPTTPQPTTPQPTTPQKTTSATPHVSGAILSESTSSALHSTTTSDNCQQVSHVGQVNIAAIILGVILALVVLIVIIAVVILRRRDTLPLWIMKSRSRNPTRVDMQELAPDSRLPVPVSLVPSGGEYAYADVSPIIDNETTVHVHNDGTNHTYANVKSEQQQRGGGLSRLLKHKPAGSPSDERGDYRAPKLPTKADAQIYEIPDLKTN